MKSAFYSTLKVLFVLKTFQILLWLFWSCRINLGLIYNRTRVNSKIYDVTNWEIIIAICILHNISKGIGNQTIKLGHLTKHKMRNVFLKKPKMKWRHYLGVFYTVLFYFIQVKKILKLRQLNSNKKQKEVWNKYPWPIFCIIFEEKYLSHY